MLAIGGLQLQGYWLKRMIPCARRPQPLAAGSHQQTMRLPNYRSFILQCSLVFVSHNVAQCNGDNVSLINVAFIRGCCSFALRSQKQHRGRHYLAPVETDCHLPDRRSFIAFSAFGATSVICADDALGSDLSIGDKRQSNDRVVSDPVTVTLPLEPASGGTFCVRVTIYPSSDASACSAIFGGGFHNDFEDSFRLFRAIVDTGSPYLVLPSYEVKRKSKWISTAFACNQNMDETRWLANSEYDPTEEVYGAVTGQVQWKLARYVFRDPILHTRRRSDGENQSSLFRPSSYTHPASGVIGVLDDALTNEATGGGMHEALLGLIRNNNPNADKNRFPDPRPSFLEQESLSINTLFDDNNDMPENQIKSFCINGPRREITFSTQPLISTTESALELIDLRKFGDFVDHYAVMVDSFILNAITVTSQGLLRPIVAVFDTGLTGCLLIRQFWDVLQKCMIAHKANASEIRSASLSLMAIGGHMKNDSSPHKMMSSIEADPLFYVEPIDLDWFDDDQCAPYVIILGQTFLRQGVLTIDIDDRRASFNLAGGS